MPSLHTDQLDAVIVGAGHAGLSVSYYLQQQGIDHVVFERGTIANSWRTQRWESFVLNTPNWMSVLPGDPFDGDDREGFMHRDEFVRYLEGYAVRFRLPVREHSPVTSVERTSVDGRFAVTTDNGHHVHCKQVVVASGTMSAPKVPAIGASLPIDLRQLHAATYRSASALPQGAVLVVGSGQSGCQIAEDLLLAGRKVFLATSKVGRFPRRYRGRDILEWCIDTKCLDVRTDSITDPQVLRSPQPQVSGIGRLGHTVSLQDLHRQGATILGHLQRVDDGDFVFSSNAAEHVRFADEFSEKFRKMIDDYIAAHGVSAAPWEEDPADAPDPNASCVEPRPSLNIRTEGVTSVIWTTGFTADFNWIRLPVLNDEGLPVHTNGASPVDGLFFIGFPWLTSRKSGIVYGMLEDAPHVAKSVLQNLGR